MNLLWWLSIVCLTVRDMKISHINIWYLKRLFYVLCLCIQISHDPFVPKFYWKSWLYNNLLNQNSSQGQPNLCGHVIFSLWQIESSLQFVSDCCFCSIWWLFSWDQGLEVGCYFWHVVPQNNSIVCQYGCIKNVCPSEGTGTKSESENFTIM